jgi:hypothetical protein
MRPSEVLWAAVDLELESDLSKPSEVLLETVKALHELYESTKELKQVSDEGKGSMRELLVHGLVFEDALTSLYQTAKKNSSVIQGVVEVVTGYLCAGLDTAIVLVLDAWDDAKVVLGGLADSMVKAADSIEASDLPNPKEHITPGLWYLSGEGKETEQFDKVIRETDHAGPVRGFSHLARRFEQLSADQTEGVDVFLEDSKTTLKLQTDDAERASRKLQEVARLSRTLSEKAPSAVANKYGNAITKTEGWRKMTERAKGGEASG